jgi:hypothetical protein
MAQAIDEHLADAAADIRSLAGDLTSDSLDPGAVASRLRMLASDLEDLARKLKRAARDD